MYSSIKRVDIVAEEDGVEVCIQTDHRAPDEMDEDAELSVLFALTRTLLPRRFATDGKPMPVVRYAALQGASRAVAEAVASTGSQLESMESGNPTRVPFDGPVRTPAEVADGAFKGLAHRVLLREGLPLSAEGLATFESRIQDANYDLDDDEQEIEAWTAVLELAAVTGETIRHHNGGHWVLTEDAIRDNTQGISAADFGLLPFAFSHDNGHISNAANKAVRAMTEPGQSTVQLLVPPPPTDAEGTTILCLKPAGWGTDGMVARKLFDSLPDSPIIVVAQDHPDSVAYSVGTDKTPEEIESMFDEGKGSLAEVEVQIEKLDLEVEMDLYLVHGDYYAAEKVLDPMFMMQLHQLLGQELLAVAIPVKGRLFVTAGVQNPDNLARLMALAQGVHESEPNPITPHVFGVMNGEVSALIQPKYGEPEPEPEPPKKKSLWRRLFH